MIKSIKRLLILLLILAPFALLSAQTGGGGRTRTKSFSLTVNSNVQGAEVFIDNTRVGTTPYTRTLRQATYEIKVTAPGYQDFTTTVNLNQNTTVNAELVPDTAIFRVLANVQNGQVFLNNQYIGRTGQPLKVNRGNYNLVVKANGYQDHSATVNITRDTNLNVQLRPLTGRLIINIPSALFQNQRNQKASLSQIKIFIDNQMQRKEVLTFDLEAGPHTIRIETGGLKLETEVQIQAGQDLSVNLVFDLDF